MAHKSNASEIGSQEEQALVDAPEGFNNSNWIEIFFGESNEKPEDANEIVVDEKPKQQSKSQNEDCMVLDANSNNTMTFMNDHDEDNDSNDVHLIEQSGPVACRDYPHPRHLCAIFLFTSTPHEKHCAKCYCYICDLPAPCLKWGTSNCSRDHCHATDKDEMWKVERQASKLCISSQLPVLTNYGASSSVANPQQNQVAPLDDILLRPNSMPQNQPSRAIPLRPSSLFNPIRQNQVRSLALMRTLTSHGSYSSRLRNQTTNANAIPVSLSCPTINFTVPIRGSRGSIQTSGSTFARNRFHSQVGRPLGVRNNVIRRGRGSNLGFQFHYSITMPTRISSAVRSLTMDVSTYFPSRSNNYVNATDHNVGYSFTTGLSNNTNFNGLEAMINLNLSRRAMQNGIHYDGIGFSNEGNVNSWNGSTSLNLSLDLNLGSTYGQPNLNFVIRNATPSETQASPQLLFPSYDGQNFHQPRIPVQEAPPTYMTTPWSNNQYGNDHIGIQYEEVDENNPMHDASQQELNLENSWSEIFNQVNDHVIENPILPGAQFVNQPPNVNEANNQFFAELERWLLEVEAEREPIPEMVDGLNATEPIPEIVDGPDIVEPIPEMVESPDSNEPIPEIMDGLNVAEPILEMVDGPDPDEPIPEIVEGPNPNEPIPEMVDGPDVVEPIPEMVDGPNPVGFLFDLAEFFLELVRGVVPAEVNNILSPDPWEADMGEVVDENNP